MNEKTNGSTINGFTCSQDKDGWWDIWDRDGIWWTTLKWEEDARKYCADRNYDTVGIRYWQKKLYEKEQLWSEVCEIETERRDAKIRNKPTG